MWKIESKNSEEYHHMVCNGATNRSVKKGVLSPSLSPFLNHWLSLQCVIGSQQCDLFTNRTIFCSKSHLFLSQWEWDSKTKQPIRFYGVFKLTNHIAGKRKSHRLANLANKWWCQNGSTFVAIELRVLQFWSVIILAISNQTRAVRSFDFEITGMLSDQIALYSVQLPLLINWLIKYFM